MAVFWIEQGYDRERAAAPSSSRYREHVRSNLADLSDSLGDIAPVRFACAAWRLATPPTLSPGYVRAHRRVLSAACVRNEYDGGLGCRVSLVAPWPRELTSNRVWAHDRAWREWPVVLGQYVEPLPHDLARAPYARATLLVEAPLPVDRLPPAPATPDEEVPGAATRAVAALARELNALLEPLLRQLEPA
jgi:hypothetical protein